MKSSYELAMERLNKSSPAVKVTEAQKSEMAELDSIYAAKLAERELFLKGEMHKATANRDIETIQHLEKQFISERKSIAAELEEKKDRIRMRTK